MRYLSICDTFEENAKRHEANAARHVAEGHPLEYAAGSLRKAAKWQAKKEWFVIPTHLEAAYDATKAEIEKKLFGS